MKLISSLAALAIFASLAISPTQAAAPAWPQAKSDLPADPDVRFGVLANGMRYAIMKNATPVGQTSLRLRIGSGSLEESDADQGLAHVLEHMAFKGSAKVPAGEMIKILQRKGLAFGPDTNAQTGWSETVYMLDLPHSDEDTLDTGLMLMRETAGNLTLDAKALASERGVVLSEERLRDTPAYRAEVQQIDLWLTGQLAARRFPIGLVDVITKAPISQVRAFYEANYRPERGVLIAVGDFDPGQMEAKIRAGFSDWHGVGPATREPVLGQPVKRGETFKVIALPGASTHVAITWERPHDPTPDSMGKEQRETVENLALSVLNRRMSVLAQSQAPPFMRASASFDDLFRSAKIAVIDAESAPESWPAALTATLQEVRRLTAYGVTQAELDREIIESRAASQNALRGAPTRPTPALAGGLVQSVDEDGVFTAPVENALVFEGAVKDLKAETVNAALAKIFAGTGPLVTLTTPVPPANGQVALAEVFHQAMIGEVKARKDATQMAWPYESFGPPGTVVSRTPVTDLGVVNIRFANGVGLSVKTTDYRKDQVLVGVRVGRGRLDLSRTVPSTSWALGALLPGGLGKIGYEDMQRTLAGKIHGENFSLGNDAFEFSAATRPADLATQLQVLTAYVADPGYRPEAFERTCKAYLSALPQLAATPDGVLERDLPSLLVSGDARWQFPTATDLTGARPDDLKALVHTPLADGALDVVVVGDVSVDQAIQLVASTFGALPPRPLALATTADGPHFPAPDKTQTVLTHLGRADQAEALVAWPFTDFFADMQKSRAAKLLAAVLENRLIDEVRIAQGATYSPDARAEPSQTFAGYGYFLVEVEIPPEKIPGFFTTVNTIVADIREKGVSADELTRAKAPRIAGLKRAQLTNEYWLADLGGAFEDPRRLDLIRTTVDGYDKVTAADVQAAAKTWMTEDRAWRLVVRAKAPATK